MGASAAKGLCGKNFGYFPETADSPVNSDDDEPDSEAERYMPKGYRQAMREEKNKNRFMRGLKRGETERVAVVGRGWGPYMVQVEANGVRLPGVRAHKARISGPMLEKLKAVGSLHTLELIHCKLKDLPPIHHIDDLTVLQVSENSIRTIILGDNETAIKASKLEKFICDRNQVESISPGVFSGSMVTNLIAINLAHNNIAFLPRDFGHGARSLLFLDLSYNRLSSLPSDLAQSCSRLQGLYLQRNELRALPGDLGALRDLRKLFLSHNKLRAVPDSVGECSRLEKVRLIANEIRYLPDSFIHLWKQKGGRLEELLVDGNPLVQPSITAFEMGGLDRAMRLFSEWLEEKAAEEQGELLALPPAEGTAQVLPPTLSIAEAAFESETPQVPVIAEPRAAEGAGLAIEVPAELEHRLIDEGKAYYFGHLTPGTGEVAEIRNAETKLLLRKKCMYIEHQQKVAREMSRKQGKAIPAHLQVFLGTKDQPFRVEQFTGKIPVTDLDLYFNLLVFSTRPMFPSCKALFEKFHVEAASAGGAGLSLQEWNNLCNRVPVKLPSEVKGDMWSLLSSKGANGQHIRLVDFLAGWHIHDIEHQDPFIQRVAKVQNLDYYDMDVEEMQERLKARGATEATLPLAFENADGDANEQEKWKAALDIAPPALEGERRQGRRPDVAAAGQHKVKEDTNRRPQVSMTTAQYVEGEGHEAGPSGDEDEADAMDSDVLSRDEDSELSAFDAQEIMQEMREALQQMVAFQADGGEDAFGMLDTTDPVTPLARHRQQPKAKAKAAGRKKKDSGPAMGGKDARFRTDVFQVRVALREAFRNLPYEDFKRLVNFLVRGMKRISDFASAITYWHIDDPSFRHATGVGNMHSYAQKLLITIGFVLVADTYWVWPEKHLSMGLDWAHETVPPECPGLSPYRLDDIVRLLKECQKRVSTEGKGFRGHFP